MVLLNHAGSDIVGFTGLVVDPIPAQLQRMRLGLGHRLEAQLAGIQFLNFRDFVLWVENQTPAMPAIAGATNADPVNRMFFVLGHSTAFQ